MKWFYQDCDNEKDLCNFLNKLCENGIPLDHIKLCVSGRTNWATPVAYYFAKDKISK